MRILTAVVVAVALAFNPSCDPVTIPAGTVTGKGITNDCHWITIQPPNSHSTQRCIPPARWATVREGSHWPG